MFFPFYIFEGSQLFYVNPIQWLPSPSFIQSKNKSANMEKVICNDNLINFQLSVIDYKAFYKHAILLCLQVNNRDRVCSCLWLNPAFISFKILSIFNSFQRFVFLVKFCWQTWNLCHDFYWIENKVFIQLFFEK